MQALLQSQEEIEALKNRVELLSSQEFRQEASPRQGEEEGALLSRVRPAAAGRVEFVPPQNVTFSPVSRVLERCMNLQTTLQTKERAIKGEAIGWRGCRGR